jgi:hypothetical protein
MDNCPVCESDNIARSDCDECDGNGQFDDGSSCDICDGSGVTEDLECQDCGAIWED